MLGPSGSLRTGLKSELKSGLQLKQGILAGAVPLERPLVLAQVGAAGEGLATLQADVGLLTAVRHLVDEQVGAPAEALATLAASIRLLARVRVLVQQQM